MTRWLAMAGWLACLTVAVGAQVGPSSNPRNEQLATLLRTAQYADARRLIDSIMRTQTSPDLQNVREMFWAGPNMRVSRNNASFPCAVSDTGVLMPLTVNGNKVEWLLDTGANVTIISDAEAKRLGLEIFDGNARANDLAGGSVGVRSAVARRVVIGRTVLENVLFLITSADDLPWTELPEGRQGILGLPLAIALDAVRWTRDGTCHTGRGAIAGRPGTSNLRYDRLQLIAEVALSGRTLEFVLDTGNQAGTQFWERFGRDFEALVNERGRKSTVQVTQIGGNNVREVMAIPDFHLSVGGKDVALAEAHVFSRPVGDDRFHGLLGMDVLRQATEVSIDFRNLVLKLANSP